MQKRNYNNRTQKMGQRTSQNVESENISKEKLCEQFSFLLLSHLLNPSKFCYKLAKLTDLIVHNFSLSTSQTSSLSKCREFYKMELTILQSNFMLLTSIIMYCEMSENILENIYIYIKTHISNTEIYSKGKYFHHILFCYSANWPSTEFAKRLVVLHMHKVKIN